MNEFDISELVIISASKTRLFVIDRAVMLEDILSFAISKLLDINYEKSKSLGHSSESLSFNQKVILIQDKKGIPRETKTKLEVFMHIRNKFAHVKTVDTFENYFNLSKNCLDNRKLLNKWYNKPEETFIDSEVQYKTYFYNLTNELFYYIFNIVLAHGYTESMAEAKKMFNENFIEILKERNLENPITIDIWNDAIKEAVSEMKKKKNSA